MLNFKGMRFPAEAILVYIRWYAAYQLSTRHRAVKRMIKPILNFKSFHSAKNILAGIELMHMIHKGQLHIEGGDTMSFADQFYVLAGQVRPA